LISRARASERACGRGFTLVRAIKLLPLSLLRPPSSIMRPSLLRSRCYVILQRAVLRVPNRLSRTPASCDLMDENRSERTPGRSLSENHRYAADRENKWSKGRRSPTRSTSARPVKKMVHRHPIILESLNCARYLQASIKKIAFYVDFDSALKISTLSTISRYGIFYRFLYYRHVVIRSHFLFLNISLKM